MRVATALVTASQLHTPTARTQLAHADELHVLRKLRVHSYVNDAGHKMRRAPQQRQDAVADESRFGVGREPLQDLNVDGRHGAGRR